jgi:hypothetical protein
MIGNQMERMKIAVTSKSLVHCWLLRAHPEDSSCQETVAQICKRIKIPLAQDYYRENLIQSGGLDHLFLLLSQTKAKGNLEIGIIWTPCHPEANSEGNLCVHKKLMMACPMD